LAAHVPRSAGSQRRCHAVSGTESGACAAARLPSGRPPSLPPSPPPICGRLCSRLHRYYAAVRLLASSTAAASPLRLPVVARPRHGGLGEMRSPRVRRVPFIRNGVSDHGRVVAPGIAVRNMLPSPFATASASAGLSLSRLNISLHMIAVYASWPSSPAPMQPLATGRLATALPRPDFHRLDRASFAWRTANRISQFTHRSSATGFGGHILSAASSKLFFSNYPSVAEGFA
jgi:hypothetical protein